MLLGSARGSGRTRARSVRASQSPGVIPPVVIPPVVIPTAEARTTACSPPGVAEGGDDQGRLAEVLVAGEVVDGDDAGQPGAGRRQQAVARVLDHHDPVSTSRPILAGEEHPAATLVIQKTLLWTDENRILDVALVNSSSQYMIVLEPESVSLFKFQGGRAQQEQSLPVAHSRPWPRDLRGRLVLRKDHVFDAYLPGNVLPKFHDRSARNQLL